MDFWIRVTDQHVFVVCQIEEGAANSDNGIYVHHYGGFYDRIGTETEAPYPLLVFASSRSRNVNPKLASSNITSIVEHRHVGNGPGFYWNWVSGGWRSLENDDTSGVPAEESSIMLPVGVSRINTGSQTGDRVVQEGSFSIEGAIFELDRTPATRVLRLIPGTVDQFFLWPLTISYKAGSAADAVNDVHYGQCRDVFWISSDDGTGSRIADFSEDTVTVNGDRYIVFHNHVHTEPYQYYALKWD